MAASKVRIDDDAFGEPRGKDISGGVFFPTAGALWSKRFHGKSTAPALGKLARLRQRPHACGSKPTDCSRGRSVPE